jgi:hypothetical protein
MSNSDKLSKCQKAFQSWRNVRAKKQRIPDELWQMAVKLIDEYPISHVARELGLNATQLRKQQIGFKEQKRSMNKTRQKRPFIELNQFLPVGNSASVSSTVQLQIEKADGVRLTLSLNSSQSDTVQNLVTAFIRS